MTLPFTSNTASISISRTDILAQVMPMAQHGTCIPALARRGVCHQRMLDLAVSWYIPAGSRHGHAPVTHRMLAANGLSTGEINEAASRNMWNSYTITELPDLLNCLDSHRRYGLMGLEMYVATARTHLYGAGLVASPHSLRHIAGHLGSFFLLPTSIHEFCIVPSLSRTTIYELYQTVCEINVKYTPAGEQLSDNVYIVDEKGRVESYL